ncbi:MAG TPA: hypothetical protein VLD67_05465 [Vicinamibacterales bacterium]|nr:hypothetical protein [Vicinamibacterales bacterium]
MRPCICLIPFVAWICAVPPAVAQDRFVAPLPADGDILIHADIEFARDANRS